MPLSHRRSFCVASLTLSALLVATHTMADTPVAAPTAQTVYLSHVVPGDIVKAQHWEQVTNLPAGVTQITSQPTTNSLSVVATPDGFAKVQQIVNDLDVAPRQVQVKFAQASVTDAELKASGINFDPAANTNSEAGLTQGTYTVTHGPRLTFLQSTTGKDVALFLQTLTKQRAITQAPIVTTSDNVDASLSMSFIIQPPKSSAPTFETFAVTPRITHDDFIILELHPIFSDGTTKREIRMTRAVKSGDTLVLVMPTSPQSANGKDILLFVTPTVLPAEKSSIPGK